MWELKENNLKEIWEQGLTTATATTTATITIKHMKKLLESDSLRAVQFNCNTSAKSVTPVQITHRNSGL